MAITTVVNDSRLKLTLENGINDSGESILKTKTFSNLKTDAQNEDVYEVADSMSKLQKLPLLEVSRVDEVTIIKE